MKKRLRHCSLGWIAAALLCWLFYSTSQPDEIAAAGVIGLVVTVFVGFLGCYAELNRDVRWPWMKKLLLRLPWQLPRAIAQILAVLWRSLVNGTRPVGSFRETCFSPEDHKIAPGRRALILVAVSSTPNTFAVSFQNGNRLLFHQLASSAESPREDWQL